MNPEVHHPKASVIIPTHNRATLLPRAMNSVLSQTFTDFELIIVDDASQDNTERVVRSISDPRIRYLRHEIGRGGAAARNSGIREAKGKFIAFLDDDDEWLPAKLEKQIAVFCRQTNNDLGVVLCGSKVYRAGTVRQSIPHTRGWIYEQKLSFRHAATTSTILVLSTCLERVGGFDETLPAFQEWDLLLRLSKEYQFDYVDEVLHIYHEHDGARISSSVEKQIRAMQLISKKYAQELQARPKIMSKHRVKLGRMHMRIGQFPEAKAQIAAALRTSPMNVKHWLLFLITSMDSGVFRKSYGLYVRLSRLKRHVSKRTVDQVGHENNSSHA
jgi:glycosyltransferase involved in cell wall biosynthesis